MSGRVRVLRTPVHLAPDHLAFRQTCDLQYAAEGKLDSITIHLKATTKKLLTFHLFDAFFAADKASGPLLRYGQRWIFQPDPNLVGRAPASPARVTDR